MAKEIRIFAYPKNGVHTEEAQQLQWAKENSCTWSIKQFLKDISDDALSVGTFIFKTYTFIPMKTHTLKASEFIDWYIEDREDFLILGNKLKNRIKETGFGNITIEELFEECENIPNTLMDEFKVGSTEIYLVNRSQIKFVNDLKK